MKLVRILTLTSLTFLGACAGMDSMKSITESAKPTVTLAETQITQLNMDNVGLDIGLKIDNPNPIPLNLAGFDYTIFLNDNQLSQGKQDENVSIEASGSSTISVPVLLKMSEINRIADSLKGAKEFDYRVESTAYLDIPGLGKYPIPATSTGKLPIPRLPSISVEGIKLENLGFSSATFNVEMLLQNPNTFGIDLSELQYNLKVLGQNWANGKVPDSINLAPDTQSKVNIPLSISLSNLGSSALSLLQGTKLVDYEVSGDMMLNAGLPAFKPVKLPYEFASQTVIGK